MYSKPAGYQKTRRHSDDVTCRTPDADLLGNPHLWVKNALSAFESNDSAYRELEFPQQPNFKDKTVVLPRPPVEIPMPLPPRIIAPLPPRPPKPRPANKTARVTFKLPKDEVESNLGRPVQPAPTGQTGTAFQEVPVPVADYATPRRELQETLSFEGEAQQTGVSPSKQLMLLRTPEGRQVAPPTSPVSSFGGSPSLQSPSVFHWAAVKAEIKNRFLKRSNIWGFLEKTEFANVIGVEEKECAGRMYDVLIRQQHGSKKALRMEHLLDYFETWKRGGPLARLRVVFAMCDERGAGEITEDGLAKVLKWSAAVHQERLPLAEVAELASVLVDCCDHDKKGWITERDFVRLLETADHAELVESIDIPIGVSSDFREAVAKARRRKAKDMCRSPGRGLLPRSPLSILRLPMSPILTTQSSNPSSPKKNDSDLEVIEDPFVSSPREVPQQSAFSKEHVVPNHVSSESAVKWSRRRTWGMAHGHTNSSEFGLPVGGDGAQGFGSFNVDNYSDSIETESTFWFRACVRWPEIVLIWVWMVINIGLFMYHFIRSREKPEFHLLGYGLCVAKGSSGVLKFNLALVILPVCRRFMAFIRTLCPRLFPSFDHNLWFHRLIGVCIALSLLLHCGGHILWNFGRLTNRSRMEDISKYASWALNGQGQQYTYAGLLTRHSAAITGELMLLIFIIALPLASRRTRWTLGNMLPKRLSWLTSLGAFWHTHYLLLLVYPLVIFHGTHGPWYNFPTTTTWCWVLGPLLMYIVELFLQRCTTSISWRTVEVTKAVLHAGGVLALHMSRPSGFLYHTGMYIYLHCSAASRFHWRPMWLMSSPSDSELVVHVKSGDEGSDALIEKFRKCLALAEGVQIAFVAMGRGHHVAHLVNHSPVPTRHIEPGPTKLPGQLDERVREQFPLSIRIWERMFPKVLLDGPFNIPMQNYKRYPVLVLIGVDFNVTYFTSVVRELMRSTNVERSPMDEPQDEDDSTSLRVNVEVSGSGAETRTAGHSWRRGIDASARKPTVKKIYLVWSTQEQQSLTWFREEMDTLAAADSQGVLELHQYLTALRREGDSRSLLLKLAQSLKPHDSGIDPATGNTTQVHTHFGTPHWDAIFRKLAADHPLEQLGLFFSGPNATSLDLAFKARSYTAVSQTGTRFDYHKELF